MTPPKRAPVKKKVKPPIVVSFDRENETKGTQRFEEQGPKEARKVGYLYVKKDTDAALGKPECIEVTIKPVAA